MENNIQNAVTIGEKLFGSDIIWQKYVFDMPLMYSTNFIIYKFYYRNNHYLFIVSKEDDISIDLLKGIYSYIKNNHQETVIAYLPNRKVFNALHDEINYISFDGKYNLNGIDKPTISTASEYTKATQLVVKFLLFNKKDSYSTRYVAQKLGMSNTTIKRSYDFLEGIGAIKRRGILTSSVEYAIESKKDLFNKVSEYFIFPYHKIMKIFLTKKDIKKYKDVLYISGDNALSKYSDIGETIISEYATNQKNFEYIFKEKPFRQEGELFNIEEFIYDPCIFSEDNTIDILDTYIIISQRYKDSIDPRINQAIKELRRKIVYENRT